MGDQFVGSKRARSGASLPPAQPFRGSSVSHESPEVAPVIVHQVLRSEGQPLDATTRFFMESRFGHDFSQVRVHSDDQAAESSRAVNAVAFTVGRDIVFNAEQYAPSSRTGRQVLAHELTHVVQQGAAPFKPSADNSLAVQSGVADTLEAEPRANAAMVDLASRLRVTRSNAAQTVQCVRSGLAPTVPRSDPDEEAQRQEAINIVRMRCQQILNASEQYHVAAEAIAGAILWEALENPYFRSFSRLGPGKVHPTERSGKSEAENVEAEGRITPRSKDVEERTTRLQQPDWAIAYIGAIMQRHADNYRKIAGVDITGNPGVLCTLYQGGHSEERAQRLANRRKTDPSAQPIAADEMGPWVEQNIDFVRGLLVCYGDFPMPEGKSATA